MHGGVKGALRVVVGVVTQQVDLHQLHRPVDGVFQVAQVEVGDLLRPDLLHGTAQGPAAHTVQRQEKFSRLGIEAQHLLLDQRRHRGTMLTKLLQAAQRIELQAHFPAGQHPAQSLYRGDQCIFRQELPGHLAQGIHQHEPVPLLRLPQLAQQGLQ